MLRLQPVQLLFFLFQLFTNRGRRRPLWLNTQSSLSIIFCSAVFNWLSKNDWLGIKANRSSNSCRCFSVRFNSFNLLVKSVRSPARAISWLRAHIVFAPAHFCVDRFSVSVWTWPCQSCSSWLTLDWHAAIFPRSDKVCSNFCSISWIVSKLFTAARYCSRSRLMSWNAFSHSCLKSIL